MSNSEKFWNKMAKRYAKHPIADEEAYQKKLSVTREYLQSTMQLLELGCGTGSTALIHAPYVKHIRALDLSSEMLAIAQAKADEQNINNISFEQSRAEDFSAPDACFDVVLALSLLHLLENKEDVMAKVFKILKPGGIFVTSTVCLAESMMYLKYVTPIAKFFGLMPLVKFITAKELESSLTGVGFSIDYHWYPSKKHAVFIVAKKP